MGTSKHQMLEDLGKSCSGCGELWEDLGKRHDEDACCNREAFFAATEKDE